MAPSKLRPDERTAWLGFLAACPRFAGEDIGQWSDGPDPPDVLCQTTSGIAIGVELTKWIQSTQIKTGKDRRRLEQSYLKIIASGNEPRPQHIGRVHLHPKSLTVDPTDAVPFRNQLFDLIRLENAKSGPTQPDPSASIPANYWENVQTWNTQQGGPVDNFTAYPTLKKYLNRVWIYPRRFHHELFADGAWVGFDLPGGYYSPESLERAAIQNIRKKIKAYEKLGIPAMYGLGEFDLLCFYCDEALFHNTPPVAGGFDFSQLAANVERALASEPRVFDRIYLFHLYEAVKVIRVFGTKP